MQRRPVGLEDSSNIYNSLDITFLMFKIYPWFKLKDFTFVKFN